MYGRGAARMCDHHRSEHVTWRRTRAKFETILRRALWIADHELPAKSNAGVAPGEVCHLTADHPALRCNTRSRAPLARLNHDNLHLS